MPKSACMLKKHNDKKVVSHKRVEVCANVANLALTVAFPESYVLLPSGVPMGMG